MTIEVFMPGVSLENNIVFVTAVPKTISICAYIYSVILITILRSMKTLMII